MALHLPSQLGDEVLRLHAQHHGQRVRRDRLDQHGDRNRPEELVEPGQVAVGDHIVDERARGDRQNKSGQAVQKDENEADQHQLAPGPDDLVESVP